MYQRFAVITGMPRSGTSWIGQIVDSAPEVRYRMSPMFSYSFKNAIREGATREQWLELLAASYDSRDEFINQTHRRSAGEYPTFEDKLDAPPLLVFKFNRFHNILEEMMQLLSEARVVSIVRHPCGAIHSWLTAPREFPPDADPLEHWRSGAVKKTGFGDYFGFEDWKWTTRLHLRLASEYPERFRVMRYEHYVANARQDTRQLFEFLGLPVGPQTERFLVESQSTTVASEYAVYKPASVAQRWRDELQPGIREAIHAELRGSDLEEFLE